MDLSWVDGAWQVAEKATPVSVIVLGVALRVVWRRLLERDAQIDRLQQMRLQDVRDSSQALLRQSRAVRESVDRLCSERSPDA